MSEQAQPQALPVGGAWIIWSSDLRNIYSVLLRLLIKIVCRLYEDLDPILDEDVSDLISLCQAFDISIHEEMDKILKRKGDYEYLPIGDIKNKTRILYNIHIFKLFLGKIAKKASMKIETELRPRDPSVELLELAMKDIDEGTKKKLMKEMGLLK